MVTHQSVPPQSKTGGRVQRGSETNNVAGDAPRPHCGSVSELETRAGGFSVVMLQLGGQGEGTLNTDNRLPPIVFKFSRPK